MILGSFSSVLSDSIPGIMVATVVQCTKEDNCSIATSAELLLALGAATGAGDTRHCCVRGAPGMLPRKPWAKELSQSVWSRSIAAIQ